MLSTSCKSVIFLSLIFSISPLLSSPEDSSKKPSGSISFQEIGNVYVPSFGVVAKPEIDPKKIVMAAERRKQLKDLIELTDGEKRESACALFASREVINKESKPSYIYHGVRMSMKELEFLCGRSKPEAHFISRINNCATVCGEVMLAKMLLDPCDDVTALRARQTFVKKLVESPQLYADVQQLLHELRDQESAILSLWRADNPITQRMIESNYLPKFMAGCDKTPMILQMYALMGYIGHAFKSVGHYFMLAGFDRIQNRYNIPNEAALPSRSYAQALYNRAFCAFDTDTYPFGLPHTYSAIFAVFTGFNSYMQAQEALLNRDVVNCLQTRLIGLASSMEIAQTMDRVLSEEPTSGLMHRDELVGITKNSRAELAQLIKMLETDTFTDQASFFSYAGRVLAAYKMVETEKEYFVGMMQALAEIDACFSTATLYKKHAGDRAQFCFVEYLEDQKPYVKLENFWNPFIDNNVVVTNTIELGKQGAHRSMIVTGSNTGGKSTLLKSIMLSQFAARMGIAPASRMLITPCTYLATSLKMSDDLASGISLFQAEVNRSNALAQAVHSLAADEHGIIVIDELYIGTDAKKGAQATKELLEYFAKFPNVMVVIATHAADVTLMAEKTNGVYKNFKFDAYKDASGKIICPYKLEEGVSASNIANDILDDEIDDIDFGA